VNEYRSCPLCDSDNIREVQTQDMFLYFHCLHCKLIYRDKAQLPSAEEEKKRYEQHHNNLANQGYVNFLYQAIWPSLTYLSPGSRILDYGCGPVPVLAQLLGNNHQMVCDYYDPFFYPDVPDKEYDFIFCTEVFEHFFAPKQEIDQLSMLLTAQAHLCIMTEFWHSLEQFEQWWYRRDFTHICFYHPRTFDLIAGRWNFFCQYQDHQRIVILQKH